MLAGELAAAEGDYRRAFIACEREMGKYEQGGRSLARHAARTLIPASRAQVWALAQSARLISRLPVGPIRAAARLSNQGLRLADSMAMKDYAGKQRPTT